VALVKEIARMGRDPSNDLPFKPVKIIHISIEGSSGAGSKKPASAHRTPH